MKAILRELSHDSKAYLPIIFPETQKKEKDGLDWSILQQALFQKAALMALEDIGEEALRWISQQQLFGVSRSVCFSVYPLLVETLHLPTQSGSLFPMTKSQLRQAIELLTSKTPEEIAQISPNSKEDPVADLSNMILTYAVMDYLAVNQLHGVKVDSSLQGAITALENERWETSKMMTDRVFGKKFSGDSKLEPFAEGE